MTPLQEPKDFDHGIGADRFRVVRGAFWWHVLIGDSPTEHGKFRSRAGAEKMAADLLREFRNGAFVQREAALAEPVQEPVAWLVTDCIGERYLCFSPPLDNDQVLPLYPASPQRKPLTEEEIDGLMQSIGLRCADDGNERMANHAEWERRQRRRIARAIERAHGIT